MDIPLPGGCAAALAIGTFDTAKSARFSGSVPSTHRFAASMRAAGTIYPCPSRSETRSLAAKTPGFGECRLVLSGTTDLIVPVGPAWARVRAKRTGLKGGIWHVDECEVPA